jgi:Permeases of the major facilitator superfamily
VATARRILTLRDLRRFLGAYFLYEDGVNTVVAFSAIFAAQTLGFPMERLIILYIVVQSPPSAGHWRGRGPSTASAPSSWS